LRKTKGKVVPVRAIRACGGSEGKDQAIIANDLSVHGPITSLPLSKGSPAVVEQRARWVHAP